jgi:hypothetical protein
MYTAILTVVLPVTDVFGSAIACGNKGCSGVAQLIRLPPVAKRNG